ncbi:hypothetical protein HNR40_005117 [Nonomuraea endophytica]|uniref:Uncharacterized protein n=1 Tax=Nonomuraea endophytica TaxID=714136 RepID=A0A7W8EHN8_9ACTN|nr:hypothetical protein [Nonomuraea endophytica]
MTSERAGIGRITAAIVAMAAMLPYLTIKLLWLAGNHVGVSDPALLANPVMVAMNAMTFGMDLVGLVLALSFTMRWGMRLPAWLVLLPMWVGIGLLSVILVTAPVGVLVEGLSVFPADGPIAPWVYMAVYGGFIGQAIGLSTAFALYARDRWPRAFRAVRPAPTATLPLQRIMARGALAVALPLAGIKLFWAFGGTLGLPPEMAAASGTTAFLQNGLKGALIAAAAFALLALVKGYGGRTLAIAWVGSGSMFGWGLYGLIVTLSAGPLAGPVATPVPDLVELFATLTGLVMAGCGAIVLAERSGVGHVHAAQDPLEGQDGEGDRRAADQRDHAGADQHVALEL